MGVRSLGYVRLTAVDVEQWRHFAGGFLGMMATEARDDGSVRFRMDDYSARLVVSPGDEPALAAMGLEVTDRAELAGMVDTLRAEGVEVREGSAEEARERDVTSFVSLSDPSGNPIELYYGPRLARRAVVTPGVSGFVTGDMGMGHLIVSVGDIEVAHDFYTRLLGFVERNTMARGQVVFMGCNPRHHTLGINQQEGRGRLMHLMVEARTLDDVGTAMDRARDLEIPMMLSLGRHTNDKMVSFYVYSPEYYAVEFGYDGLRVEGHEPTYEISSGEYWGHHFSPPPES